MSNETGPYLICPNCGRKEDVPTAVDDNCSCGTGFVFHDAFRELLAEDLLQIMRLGFLPGEDFEAPCKPCKDKNRRLLENIHGLGYKVVECPTCDGSGLHVVEGNGECPQCYCLGYILTWRSR